MPPRWVARTVLLGLLGLLQSLVSGKLVLFCVVQVVEDHSAIRMNLSFAFPQDVSMTITMRHRPSSTRPFRVTWPSPSTAEYERPRSGIPQGTGPPWRSGFGARTKEAPPTPAFPAELSTWPDNFKSSYRPDLMTGSIMAC